MAWGKSAQCSHVGKERLQFVDLRPRGVARAFATDFARSERSLNDYRLAWLARWEQRTANATDER